MTEPATPPLQVRYEDAAPKVARLLHNLPIDVTRLPEKIRANIQQLIHGRTS